MDILESLATLHIIFQLVCLSQCQYVRSNHSLRRSILLTVYTIIVLSVACVLLLYGLFSGDKDFIKTAKQPDVGDTVDFIQMIGIRISHIVCLGESLLQTKTLREFYEGVREIDKIFECAFNVDVNNHQFRKKMLQRAGIMFCVYLISELFILATKLFATPEHCFLLFWIFYLMPLFVCAIRYFHIYTAVNIINLRFDELIDVLISLNLAVPTSDIVSNETTYSNDHMTREGQNVAFKLSPKKTFISKSTPSFIFLKTTTTLATGKSTHNELLHLLVARDLYNRLWEVTALFNRCFGVSILINVGNDFISITSNCYWIFLSFKEFDLTMNDFLQIAGSAVWSVPHLFNVLVLALICERTQQSTTRVALSLHRINIDIGNENHNSVIEQFSLQLLHQKIAFSAAGFINVDCTLLYTIVGATTTYLIILIQFHMSEVSLTSN